MGRRRRDRRRIVRGAAAGGLAAGVWALQQPLPATLRGTLAAQAENFGLWPAARLSDRFHPARDAMPRLAGNRAALAQATWRHLLFGVLMGGIEQRLNRTA